ncbi:TetR/AcrR family transcriptional regulator [Amaricoccus solimangrovi]|uniref:TetR/AcrR family transcriptional regulator n=1 Tax=Amaricoccus solimangrovi TaxID=2589815 RepID=UPI0015E4310A|nr:TetR/AcrR family transcriptional regulator [Amaricoccus solimangrovi]
MRAKGTRNAEYDARRQRLLEHLGRALKAGGTRRPTLRELAKACGCGVSTLNHYFGRREDIVAAVFEESHQGAARQIANIRRGDPPFEESIREVAGKAWMALADRGVARTLALGLAEGLGSPRLGEAYISEMFDPFILALAERLASHIARGEMREVDPRMAALALASPLLLAALHQRELQGERVLPLASDDFVEHLAAAFIRAYRAEPAGSEAKNREG